MTTLNKLPDGSPSPVYRVTARSRAEEPVTHTEDITEWWYEGKQVCPIEESIGDFFYQYFDKCSFEVLSCKLA